MPTLCPFLMVPWVGLQSVIVAFLSHTLFFFLIFESTCIIIVGDKTIVLHKICSSLNKLKTIRLPETKVISFCGLCNLLYTLY